MLNELARTGLPDFSHTKKLLDKMETVLTMLAAAFREDENLTVDDVSVLIRECRQFRAPISVWGRKDQQKERVMIAMFAFHEIGIMSGNKAPHNAIPAPLQWFTSIYELFIGGNYGKIEKWQAVMFMNALAEVRHFRGYMHDLD